MPLRRPRFWIEMIILGFVLVFGMANLQALLPDAWAFFARVFFAAALFGVYGLHYERYWNRPSRK